MTASMTSTSFPLLSRGHSPPQSPGGLRKRRSQLLVSGVGGRRATVTSTTSLCTYVLSVQSQAVMYCCYVLIRVWTLIVVSKSFHQEMFHWNIVLGLCFLCCMF